MWNGSAFIDGGEVADHIQRGKLFLLFSPGMFRESR